MQNNLRQTLRRFRNMSGGFLHNERTRHFAVELTIFGVLALASAWPMRAMIDALGSALR